MPVTVLQIKCFMKKVFVMSNKALPISTESGITVQKVINSENQDGIYIHSTRMSPGLTSYCVRLGSNPLRNVQTFGEVPTTSQICPLSRPWSTYTRWPMPISVRSPNVLVSISDPNSCFGCTTEEKLWTGSSADADVTTTRSLQVT